jgi:hypothetical protein
VIARLGRYFADVGDVGEVPAGYSAAEDFGDGGIVGGISDQGHEFTFVRWRWAGRHGAAIPSRVGGPDLVEATGNPVVVEGITAVEQNAEGEFRAHWFVDWLSVYAQLGVVAQGRPTSLEHIELRSPLEEPSTR